MALSDDAVLAALKTQRDAVLTELAGLTVNAPNIGVDGVSISFNTKELEDRLFRLNQEIERRSGPCVVYTQGR